MFTVVLCLDIEHFRVFSVLCHQLVVASVFDQTALLEHRDTVAESGRCEPVRYIYRGLFPDHLIKALIQSLLGQSVKRGCGLVKNHDLRALVKRLCQSEFLLFTARKIDAVILDDLRKRSIDALCQSEDTLLETRVISGFGHFVAVQIFASRHRNILGHQEREYLNILENRREKPVIICTPELPDVGAVQGDIALGRIVEPKEKLYHRGLSRTVKPHHSELLAGTDLQVQMGQGFFIRLKVFVADIDKLDLVGIRIRKWYAVLFILGRFKIDERTEIVCFETRPFVISALLKKVDQRPRESHRKSKEHREIADRQILVKNCVKKHGVHQPLDRGTGNGCHKIVTQPELMMIVVPLDEKRVDLVEFIRQETAQVKEPYILRVIEVLRDTFHIVAAAPRAREPVPDTLLINLDYVPEIQVLDYGEYDHGDYQSGVKDSHRDKSHYHGKTVLTEM